MKETFDSIAINSLPIDEIVQNLSNKSFNPTHIHLAAASTFVEARTSMTLKTILNDGLVLLDSRPIWYFLNKRGSQIPQVRGTDFMRLCLSKNINQSGFFLGSSRENLANLRDLISSRYPEYQIAGMSFAKISDQFSISESLLTEISSSNADVVWVGLGSPKQDHVANFISKHLGVTTIAVGAAFDLITGTVREAPLLIQKCGLEWLYRLSQEPIRLLKRYSKGNLILIWMFIKEISSK